LSQNFSDQDVGKSQLTVNTDAGSFNIELFDQQAPQTVNNFFNYIEKGAYNNSIFHRSAKQSDGVTPFVLQGGGFQFSSNPGNLTAIPTDPPVLNEPGISNTRGTLAMAKLGNDPNSATSQWFVNLANNSSNLDNQNGGFTVFGQVTPDTMTTVDALAKIPTQDRSKFNSALTDLPLQNYPQPPAG